MHTGLHFCALFPPEEPQKFANVHKIFGASNVTKLLNELLPHQREDAVNSLAYEAEARVRDPVYGCISAISFLQRQVERLQKELDAANADLIRFACNGIQAAGLQPPPAAPQALASTHMVPTQPRPVGGWGGRFYQTPSFPIIPYSSSMPWNDNYNPHGGGVDGSI
ncbi:protein LATERAL ORGAN BOUNDARIES [Sesamum angolense]|uniref:Protein LATERAL ORGAN BOUNDARIES n=1 Tax=Sesamum angolense TaxID=2727404 RepID=A0AAE1WJZ4_9LAMI|nr:protein LATERAL ORGAN BOUNDARIES [Sesamum angolense]